MATTINNYSVGLSLDASSYIDSSKLSRKETNLLKKDIEASRDPAERLAMTEDRLTKAFEAGAISLQVYNRLLESHKAKLETATPATAAKTSSLERLSQMSNVVTAGITAARAAIDVFASAKDAFDAVTARIDETTKAAQRLGLTFNEITGLRFAAGEAGVAIDTIERGIKEMIKRGFSTGDARESFMQIAEEISGMGTQAERMQRAFEVFGKSGPDMLVMLQGGRDAIEQSVAFAEKWTALTESQVIGIEQYNDTWARVGTIVQGTIDLLVAEMAPVFTLIGESIIDASGSMENLQANVRSFVDTVVYLAGWMTDIAEVASAIQTAWYRIVTLDFSGMQEDVEKAMDFGTAEKYLQQLYDKRFELEQAGQKRVRELESTKEQARLEAIAEEAKAREEAEKKAADEVMAAWEKAREEERKKAEIADKERIKQYETALGNAAKALEQRAAEAKKIADSIAKGPESIEAGSAGAAAFLAGQTNRMLADTMETPSTSEEELLEEARRQLEVMQESVKKQNDQVDRLDELIAATKENGFRRIR